MFDQKYYKTIRNTILNKFFYRSHIYYKFRTKFYNFCIINFYIHFFEKFFKLRRWSKLIEKFEYQILLYHVQKFKKISKKFNFDKYTLKSCDFFETLLDLLSETVRFAAVYYSLSLLLARYNSKRSLNLILKIESLDYFKGPALRGASSPPLPSLFYSGRVKAKARRTAL